jgi:NADH-quinone oxidoreductase subunit J
MSYVFYVSTLVAIVSTLFVVLEVDAVHALLYLIVSLFSVAVIFFSLGAAFVAALEVIVYAGAIMVLFIFVIMMLNLGPRTRSQERSWLQSARWAGPAVLALVLLGEFAYVLIGPGVRAPVAAVVGPKQVGIALFGPYVIGVELASLVLLAGLVGAYHLGRYRHDQDQKETA